MFILDDRGIVSCSGDGIVLHTELTRQFEHIFQLNHFNCHGSGTTYEVLTVPNECKTFMSCGEDGTVRTYDLRSMSGCNKPCCKDNILILSPSAVTAMSLSPLSYHYIAIGSSDSHIRIYDRRYLSVIDFVDAASTSGGRGLTRDRHTVPVKMFTIPNSEKRPFRVTSINFSSDDKELLVSYSSDQLYLFDVTKEGIDIKKHNVVNTTSADDFRRFSRNSNNLDTPTPVRRLRLRGDWSDTGPYARPAREAAAQRGVGQARPQLQATIMNR